MAISINVDKRTFDEISKKGGRLSAEEYRELISGNSKSASSQEKYHIKFSFSAIFVKSDEESTILEFTGRHCRKNEIDGWPLRKKIQYKTALKEAVQIAAIQFKTLARYDQVTFLYEVFNPKSRDDDANFNTLKILRDSIVSAGVITDDKRKCVINSVEKEIISKEWKIIITITPVF